MLLAALAALGGLGAAPAAPPPRPSVLYIVVDDLRVELPMYADVGTVPCQCLPPPHRSTCSSFTPLAALVRYGQSYIEAPHLTALAARATVFDRCYCNQPVCSPSRNSFMSGRRPDKTLCWNFKNHFREVGPEWTTLPSHFKANGFETLGTGKLYHEDLPPNGDGANSWTDSAVQFSCVASGAGGNGTYCDPDMAKCEAKGPSFAPNPRWCAVPPPNGAPEGDVSPHAPPPFACDFQAVSDRFLTHYRGILQT